MRIDPLLTRSPESGALRPVTDDLLAEVYLSPQRPDLRLGDHLGPGAPWSASFEAAPEETARAVEAGLLAVAHATPYLDPSYLSPEALPEGRARRHLAALRDLWRDLGALPGQLDTWRHVLNARAGDALEALPLATHDCPFATPAEGALAGTLRAHHGAAEAPPASSSAKEGSALRHIQDHLGRRSDEIAPEGSIACHGLRDPREETEFATALAQSMLEAGRVESASEIGLLVPDGPAYALSLREAFDRVGLPLSGLPEQDARRDTTGELLSLFLVLLQGPAPRTALASLYVAPGMPWPPEIGRRMAREVIDRGKSRTASELDGPARDLLDALRPCDTPEQLFGRLGAFARAAPEVELAPRIATLKTVTDKKIDWPLLRRLAAPGLLQAAEGRDRFVEGVSLFTESALPWRPVRQLIVLGMAGGPWPRPPGSTPFFTEGEIALIRDSGLLLDGRRQRLTRGLDLFRRQLGAATDGLSLLVPAMDLHGNRQSPSTGLALIAHMLGAEEPTELVQDLRAVLPDHWPVAAIRPEPVPLGGAPALPETGVLHIQRGLGTPDKPGVDLLRLRETEDGPLPHSPSRLETLLVSPLGWLLDELGAKDRAWAPETLDVMTLGTLMHQVLEDVFAEGSPVPDDSTLTTTFPSVLDKAIRRHAAWLSDAAWATERASLLHEAQDICAAWARFLRDVGAEVLHNEIELKGDHGGLLLHGKADCLLKLPDGRILVVDHKRSSAGGRRTRMAKGWDLQVALYGAMLERPSEETALTRLVAEGARVVTAYHMLRDGTVLSDAHGGDVPRVETAGEDAAVNAMEHLAKVLAEVGAGTIRLNREGDTKTFDKECGIKAYALENPLVAAFCLPETQAEEDAQ